MIPYTDFLYFGISLYAILPALVTGFFKRFWKVWLVIATALMLVIQYTGGNSEDAAPVSGIVLVIGYAVIQWIVAIIFLSIRKRGANRIQVVTTLSE